MQPQPLLDQRQYRRHDASFVVSYRRKKPAAGYDITQTRNISQGGMLLTTARTFAAGEQLAIKARLPFRGSPRIVEGTAEAVEAREIVPSLLYETRVRFVGLDGQSIQAIRDFCGGKVDTLSAGGDEIRGFLNLTA